MQEGVKLGDDEIAAAVRVLVAASSGMVGGAAGAPSSRLQSLTGIGADVDLHMRGLGVARAALADAAKTAGEALSSLMAESGEVERLIADALHEGYALSGATL